MRIWVNGVVFKFHLCCCWLEHLSQWFFSPKTKLYSNDSEQDLPPSCVPASPADKELYVSICGGGGSGNADWWATVGLTRPGRDSAVFILHHRQLCSAQPNEDLYSAES